jgi:hypothetical protein
MIATDDFETDRRREVPGFPETETGKLVDSGRRRIEDADIRVDPNSREIFEPANREISGDGARPLESRRPAFE